MAKQLPAISPTLEEFIAKQHIFFVGTAASDGRVNVSPKGMNTLRVLGPNRVVWLNSTGSGNETAAHLLEVNRMTIMFCAVEGPPLILRLYGQAKTIHPRDAEWAELYALFDPIPGARQVFDLSVDLVQTSCGMAVPFMDYQSEREDLNEHWSKRTPEQIKTSWLEKNSKSIDGKPTQIFGESHD